MARLLRLVALLALLSVAAVAARIGLNIWLNAPGPSSVATIVLLPKGTRTVEIGDRLGQAGVIARPLLWPLLAQLSGRQPLLAGEYEFPAHASIATIFDMMRRGQVVVHRLVVPEGLTVLQIVALLDQADGLTGPVESPPPEGSLMPSTYFYSYGDQRAALLGRMQRGMSEALEDLWPKRGENPLLPDRSAAVTLASIVERETAIPEERPHVAAVFLNRLRLHMRLQSDPTVIYAASHGIGALDHPLNRADLALPSPYNSYVAEGLPPTPICNPGRASLLAVLHPSSSDDLYFVADGSGGHVFARSLAEHNKNVARLRRLEQGDAPPPDQKVKSAR